MNLTAIFLEFDRQYKMNMIIGEKFLGDLNEDDAHKEASRIKKVLSEIKTEKISYMLQTEQKTILGYLENNIK